MASSTSSASLWPPRAKNLMPLSGIGLWLAEIITPRSTSRISVRKATPGVGSTLASITSTPALARPAITAAARNSPDARGSRPTTAVGRCPWNAPASPRTCAAATDRSSASSAVRSRFATPRTPSVPKMRPTVVPGSALAVLRRLASLLQSVLLALLRAGVAREEAGPLERGAVAVLVDLVQGAGDRQPQRAGLPRDAAAVDARDHVEALVDLQGHERVVDQLLVDLVREVLVELAAVHRPLPRARREPDAGDGLLASTGGRAGRGHDLARGGGRRRVGRFGGVVAALGCGLILD